MSLFAAEFAGGAAVTVSAVGEEGVASVVGVDAASGVLVGGSAPNFASDRGEGLTDSALVASGDVGVIVVSVLCSATRMGVDGVCASPSAQSSSKPFPGMSRAPGNTTAFSSSQSPPPRSDENPSPSKSRDAL